MNKFIKEFSEDPNLALLKKKVKNDFKEIINSKKEKGKSLDYVDGFMDGMLNNYKNNSILFYEIVVIRTKIMYEIYGDAFMKYEMKSLDGTELEFMETINL